MSVMWKPNTSGKLIDILPDITYWNGHSVHRVLFETRDHDSNYHLAVNPILLDLKNPMQHSTASKTVTDLLCTEIQHKTSLIKAKCMPLDSRIIASLDIDGDLTLHRLEEERLTSETRPKYTSIPAVQKKSIKGRNICWNPDVVGQLAITSFDGYVSILDIKRNAIIFQTPTHYPLETAWSSEFLFGTAGDCAAIQIWDTRTGIYCLQVEAHRGNAQAIAFSPFRSENFITGGSDGTTALWDLRDMSRCLLRFLPGRHQVTHVSWSPHDKNLFAVCGYFGEASLASFRSGNLEVTESRTRFFVSIWDTAWHPVRNKIYAVDNFGEIFSL